MYREAAVLCERRYDRREISSPAVYVDLDPGNGGFLWNLSEGGLALDLLRPVSSAQVVLGFVLPERHPIEGVEQSEVSCLGLRLSGQIAWTDESGQRAGVCFVDLPERTRQQIKQWLSRPVLCGDVQAAMDAFSSPLEGAEEEEPRDTLLSARSRAGERAAVQPGGVAERRKSNLLRLVALFVGGVVLPGVLLITGYNLSRGRLSPEVSRAAAETPALSSKSPARSAGNHIVVLQVAALRQETNALAMVETLRKNRYPAYVLAPVIDRYYRVQVGPYFDTEAADLARQGLRDLGFDVMVRR